MRRVPIFKKYQEEFISSVEVNGNQVCLYRTYRGNSKYWYAIHWGDLPQTKTELLTPNGNRPSEGGAIKQFFQAVKAAKTVKFVKI